MTLNQLDWTSFGFWLGMIGLVLVVFLVVLIVLSRRSSK
jgi:hypothetical protein